MIIANQVYVFLWSIFIGACITLLFDILRAFRKNKTVSNLQVLLQDIVFVIIVMLIIIVSAFMINDGEIRGYMILRISSSED